MSFPCLLLAMALTADLPFKPIDPGALNSGKADFQPASVSGTVVSVARDDLDSRYNWLTLKSGDHIIFISTTEEACPAASLRKLIDGEIEASGRILPFCDWRQRLGSHLGLARPADIRTLTPPPADPFSAPPLHDDRNPHRQRLDGTILAAGRDRLVLRTDTGTIHTATLTPESTVPTAGDHVTIVGFAEADPFQLRLADALVRINGSTSPSDEPVPPTEIERLFTLSNGEDIVNSSYHGRLVQIRGQLLKLENPNDRAGLVRLSCGRREICADLTALTEAGFILPSADSEIEVTGYCLAEFEDPAATSLFRRFRHFTVIPRTAADVRILSRPSWWTPGRLFVVILLLGGTLLLMLVWNRMIRIVSERRGRELYRERIDHALAEQKIEERTRLAVELHDSISQTLTGVAFQLDGGKVDAAKRLLASCREELRRCLWDLRSRTFEEKDLTEAVERTIAPSVSGVHTTIRFNVPRDRLSESTVHTILRIVRELAVNAVRHGQAGHLRIAGEMHNGVISFSVRDDGSGFDPTRAPGPEEGHFGLLGVRERLEACGGSIDITSAPGAGTRISVTLNAGKDECEE